MNETNETGLNAQPVGNGNYIVKRGDTISSIADEHGHFWETIWNQPENAALKNARQHPEILLPGDRLTIPPLGQKKEKIKTLALHRFRRKGIPVKIEYTVIDKYSGKVFKGKCYKLFAGEQEFEGTTDNKGYLEHWVSAQVKKVVLVVWLEEPGYPEFVKWSIKIGFLDPINSITGLQGRLNNLGFDCGEEDGILGPNTINALKEFQQTQKLEVTGTADEPTKTRLEEFHNS